MKIIILSIILIYQALAGPFEYDEIFKNIVYCKEDGTPGSDKVYPFCDSVDESPIDLRKKARKDGDELDCHTIEWDYNGRECFDVEKKEHTIEVVMPKSGPEIFDIHEQRKTNKHIARFKNPVDPKDKLGKELDDPVEEFCLEQVHFHWDDDDENTGSEHAVGGKHYPLEAHFVHFNCDRDSVTDVQNQYDTRDKIEAAKAKGEDVHELAVIAVFFEIRGNEANPAINRILDAEELIKEQETEHKDRCEAHDEEGCVVDRRDNKETDREKSVEEWKKEQREHLLTTGMDGIDLREILSYEILQSGYWTYEGSLTTPPCTDDVRWFNMKKTSYISKAQWLRYTKITRPCNPDKTIAPNYRPIQDNENDVYTCAADRHHSVVENTFINRVKQNYVGNRAGDSDDSNDSGYSSKKNDR